MDEGSGVEKEAQPRRSIVGHLYRMTPNCALQDRELHPLLFEHDRVHTFGRVPCGEHVC